MIKFSRLLGLIISVFLSFPTSVLAESIADNSDNNNPIITEIKNEVYPSVRRLTPLLNTGILIAIFVSTSSVITVFVLFVMSIQKIQQTQENINGMKQDAISDLNQSLSEAQAVVNNLQYSLQSSQDKIHRISSQSLSSSPTEPD